MILFLFVKVLTCFSRRKVLFIFLLRCYRWRLLRLLYRALISGRCCSEITALRLLMWIIKFSLLLLQNLFLVIKFSNLLLLSLYQLHSPIRIINHLEKLLTYTLFHSRDKFSALNILSYSCLTVKPPWNIDFHCVGNLLNFFDSMIIDVSLHLMNRITWINSRDSSLIFCIFKY